MASDSVLRNRVIAFWSPRVGVEAAALYWKGCQWGYVSYASLLAFIALAVTGVPTASSSIRFIPVGIVVVGLIAFWIHFRCYQKAGKRASVLLGTKIIFVDAWVQRNPPKERNAYLEWCSKNGITPFTAGPKPKAPASVTPAAIIPSTLPESEAKKVRQMSQRGEAWHPDPSGRFPQRYYEGTTWTSWVINADGAEVIDPQGAPGNTSNL